MRKIAGLSILLATVLVAGMLLPSPASAGGGVAVGVRVSSGGGWHGGGGGWRGGGWHGGSGFHRAGWHGGWGWRAGWGWGWGPGWWGPGCCWGPGWWGWPGAVVSGPVIVQQAPPTTFVQQPQPPAQQFWYYCGSARAYYPYVSQCPEGWMQVVPSPTPQSWSQPGQGLTAPGPMPEGQAPPAAPSP